MLPVVPINWVAILAAAVVGFGIGVLWYSPGFFGPAWMKSIGMNTKKMQRPSQSKMARSYITMFISMFIMALVLSIFIHILNAADLQTGVEIGLLMWLGFIATEKISDVLFEDRHFNYYIISIMYYFVSIIVMALILVSWY